MMNKKMYIELEGYDSIERVVKPFGNSGGVLVPKLWIGAFVKTILVGGNENHIPIRHKSKTKIPSEESLYQFYGYDTSTKKVLKHGNSAKVQLPLSWIGKYVKIILINNPLEKNK